MLDVGSIVRENIELLSNELSTKKIEVTSNISEGEVCFADNRMTNMIVHNLLSNAIKFTNRGGKVLLKAELKGGNLVVSVKDTSVGMSRQVLENMFSKGIVQSTSGTENEAGTGLGIIMCKDFVARNGGQIWAESEEGEGSTFFFSLPATPTE